jgi:hypothetical protein
MQLRQPMTTIRERRVSKVKIIRIKTRSSFELEIRRNKLGMSCAKLRSSKASQAAHLAYHSKIPVT